MGETLESVLRRVMVWLGRHVERALGGLSKAKLQVETRGGVQPILSLESMLTADKIGELIAACEEQSVRGMLPEMRGKRVIEIGDGSPRYTVHFLKQRAKAVLAVDIRLGQQALPGIRSAGEMIKGALAALPFGSESLDYVVARLATPLQGDIQRDLQELGRVLAFGAQGIVIDYHPYGRYADQGSHRLRSLTSPVRGIGDYYRLCRAAGLRIIDLAEGFLDERMRKFFVDDEIHAYRSLKNTPLLVCMQVYKPKKK